jgi:hypothetical protein
MEELTIIMNLGLVHSIYGAIEMAKEFPHAKVVGVDLAPIPFEPEQMPPNCQMEIDDINLGLPHFHTRWDIVHMRCVYGGLKGEFLSGIQNCRWRETPTDNIPPRLCMELHYKSLKTTEKLWRRSNDVLNLAEYCW